MLLVVLSSSSKMIVLKLLHNAFFFLHSLAVWVKYISMHFPISKMTRVSSQNSIYDVRVKYLSEHKWPLKVLSNKIFIKTYFYSTAFFLFPGVHPESFMPISKDSNYCSICGRTKQVNWYGSSAHIFSVGSRLPLRHINWVSEAGCHSAQRMTGKQCWTQTKHLFSIR